MVDGFPCTSLSSQNNHPASFSNPDSPTGFGFRCLLDYIDFCDSDGDYLDWLITENVRNMFWHSSEFDETPIEIQESNLEKRGFMPCSALAQSANFTLKHSRQRAIGLYVKKTRTKSYLPPLESTFLSFQSQPLALHSFLSRSDPGDCSESHIAVKPSPGVKWKDHLIVAESRLGKAGCTKRALNGP